MRARGPKPTYDLLAWLKNHPEGLKMSYEEIASTSGIPLTAVRRQINLLFISNKIRRVSYLEIVIVDPPVVRPSQDDQDDAIVDR